MSKEFFYQLIGQVTVSFSHLDYVLTDLICHSINKDIQFGHDKMTFGQKLSFLDKLTEKNLIHKEIYSLLKGILPSMQKINEERRYIVHNVWYLHETADLAINHNIGYSKEVSVSRDYYIWQEIKASDLIKHISEIDLLYIEISKIFTKLINFK